jgi:hypothetical protein
LGTSNMSLPRPLQVTATPGLAGSCGAPQQRLAQVLLGGRRIPDLELPVVPTSTTSPTAIATLF